MAIKLDCPRCKQPLLVPNKKAGSYANCPRCTGRFWVAKDAQADAAQMESVMVAGPAAPPIAPPVAAGHAAPPAPPAPPGPPPAPPRAGPATFIPPAATAGRAAPGGSGAAGTVAAGGHPAGRGAPPAPPPVFSQRKVARLISAEAAQSTLKPAPDGRLPDLLLQEGPQAAKRDSSARGMNPLVLIGLLTVSPIICILMLFADLSGPSPAGVARKDVARQHVEEEFFGGGNLTRDDLKPYQLLLREAQRAHAHGDQKTERACYQKVLALLRSRPNQPTPGQPARGHVTGSESDDAKLEGYIQTILSGP